MSLTTQEPPVERARRDNDRTDVPLFLASLPSPARRYFLAAWTRRVPLGLFIGGVAVLATVLSMLLPKWYTAQCTILPPTEGGDSFGLMGALMENTALSRLGLFSSTTPSDVYVEILRSRTLRESLIVNFDLQRVYQSKGMDRTLRELDSHLRVTTTPVGIVTVRLEDRDPSRAADMANRLVDDLDRFNRESMNTHAKRTREFLEKRLVEARESMKVAETALTAYEQRNKLVASSEASAVGAMAGVISQKMSLEVRRSYMSSYTRPGSAPLRQIEAEIGAMDSEIAKLPSLKQEGSRLALDAEIQRRVFTLLTAQYEDMRVQETRDTPTLTVLDQARAPEMKSRPRRAVIVLVATAVAAMLGAAWVAFSVRSPART
jgi:tyrosine-protein kinase Etk/Wzc